MARLQLGSTRALRDEDLAPRLVSWGIAITGAAAWLTVVSLTPLPITSSRSTGEGPAPLIDFRPVSPASPPTASGIHGSGSPAQTPNVKHRSGVSAVEVAGIFAAAVAGRAIDKVAQLIPDIQTASGDGQSKTMSGVKSTIGIPDGAGHGRPGLSGFGNGVGNRSNVGQVQTGAVIARANFHATPLPIVSAPAPDNAIADATEFGAFVRARVSQLQACYERAGGTDLAGVVAIRLTLGTDGVVRTAEIVRRTWSGPGAAEAESCLLRVARNWRVPSAAPGATLTLPISFTRAG